MTTEPLEAAIVQSNAVAIRQSYQAPAYMTKQEREGTIADTLNKVALVMEVMDQVMKDGEHYGTIPGCGEKKALLKPGAEKLGLTFRLKPQFEVKRFDYPNNHREYEIRCVLSDGTHGVGTCSTLEGKYRYRSGERKCPKCGKASIIKGKVEYGGGWLCYVKKDGCGAKFGDDDKIITGQNVGKVEHDNPADFWNTVLKMGKKRAHVDAIITATACSDIFTQDVEEAVEAADNASKPNQESPPLKAEPLKSDDRVPIRFDERDEKRFRDAAEKWLESERVAWIRANTNVKAWAYALATGLIMSNEQLDALTWSQLFPLAEAIDGGVKSIRMGKSSEAAAKRGLNVKLIERREALAKAIAEIGVGEAEQFHFEAVYGPPGTSTTVPERPKAQGLYQPPSGEKEWFWDVFISVPRKGSKKSEYEQNPDTIESLYHAAHTGDDAARKRLFGLAHSMTLEPRTVGDKTYPPSEADKQTRKALDAFLAWEKAKSEEGGEQMRQATEAEPQDEVPF